MTLATLLETSWPTRANLAHNGTHYSTVSGSNIHDRYPDTNDPVWCINCGELIPDKHNGGLCSKTECSDSVMSPI